MLSAGHDYTFRVWSAETGQEIRTVKSQIPLGNPCAFSSDGTRFVTAGRYPFKTLTVSDPNTGEELCALEGHTEKIRACGFSPDGTRVVSASHKVLKVWEANTGQELRTLEAHSDWVTACTFSPDGMRVVSASDDKSLSLSDTSTGARIAILPLPGNPTAVAYHPSLPTIACGDRGGSLYFIDLLGITMDPIVGAAGEGGLGPEIGLTSI